MNPSNHRGQPPSFKTNVNRAKTKRWVEAKSYTYDGDDWGDADEYDEYDGYEPEPAQPATGRPPGPPGAPHGAGPHGAPQPMIQGPAGRGRTDSFGPDDERRAFSGSHGNMPQPVHTAYAQFQQPQGGAPVAGRPQPGHHPSQSPPPPQGYPPYQQPPQQHRRPSVDSQGRPVPPGPGGYPAHPPRANSGSRAPSMTSNVSAGSQHRDFSNVSAMPPALQPQRPPRKSSLSQSEAPPGVDGSDQIVSPVTDASDSQQRERSASGSAPVFVRPADIYRRMHEEKERERLSQESARPSIDAINKSSDESPARSGDEDGHQRKLTLEPVAERRSEYGMEGLLAAKGAVEEKPPSRGPSGSPMLPDIKGLGGGLGDDFGISFTDTKEQPAAVPLKVPDPSLSSEPQQMQAEPAKAPVRKDTASMASTVTATLSPTANAADDGSLQHQPSRGFRSAVHTAFDQPIRQRSSATDSTVGRSNSDSTNAISPINTRPASFHGPEHPPTIPEEPSTASARRGTGDTITAPRPFAAEDTRRSSAGSLPGFVPGHRRDMNTPSPNNSPARTPILESNKQLSMPQEVEVGLTTPASTEHSGSPEHEMVKPNATDTRHSRDLPQLRTPTKAQVGSGTGTSTPQSRSESPTKGRVRDLTDKYETTSSHGSNSPVKESAMKDGLKPREESPARNDSFRPGMPGGWVSYAPSVSSNQPQPAPSTTSRTGSNVSSDPTKAPFAAAAAAGSALAGALVTAVGGEQSSDTKSDAGSTREPVAARRQSKQDTAIHPEATRFRAPVEDIVSSVQPTPLDNEDDSDKRQSAYFAPVAPLKQKDFRTASGKQLPSMPQVPPGETLSVENSPNDQESDRLRKELVRELSPQTESFGKDAFKTPSPQQPSSGPNDPRLSTVTHDSSILPSEYDSYWAGSPHATGASPQVSQKSPDAIKADLFPTVPPPQDGPIKPFDIHRAVPTSTGQDGPSHAADSGRPMLQQRFSWEAPADGYGTPKPVSPLPTPGAHAIPSMGMTGSSSIALAPMAELDGERPPTELDASERTTNVGANKALPQQPIAPGLSESPFGAPSAVRVRTSLPSAPEPASGQTLTGGPLPPAPFTSQQKAPTFKEIMALRAPADRINKFNEAREQVASEETGLDQWILYMTQNVEDHASAIRAGGVPQQTAAAAATAAPSATATSTPFGTPGSATGPSPASGKPRPAMPTMNTSKAKEIFSSGGKASKSKAKELFSKGRSKFRSSGSEKVDH